ncbi:MAG: GNAT family N-acetyltransferase [Polyangiaceae bacterium]
MTRTEQVIVRAARPGEGARVAALWRELWDAHERWGGYPGSRDPAVYAQVAGRLDDDARIRSGHVLLGRHAHLVAELNGRPCGQVEGWLEQLGSSGSCPMTCEVRSLIVGERARRVGAGRALLRGLADAAGARSVGSPCVLAAEVLEPNPAHAFYGRVGFAPVSWSARIDAATGPTAAAVGVGARLAVAHDALAIARLEATLAARRRAAGDLRFDRPKAVDATLVQAIAAHLVGDAGDPVTLVAVDAGGNIRATASFTVQLLEPPFLPLKRALLGRFATDPAHSAHPLVGALVSLGCRMALASGARSVELVDLSAPGSELYDAALAAGATPWSRVVTKLA